MTLYVGDPSANKLKVNVRNFYLLIAILLINVNVNVNMKFIVPPLLKEHGCIT